LLRDPAQTVAEVAKLFKVSPATLYNYGLAKTAS
jgi:hypothetical protein